MTRSFETRIGLSVSGQRLLAVEVRRNHRRVLTDVGCAQPDDLSGALEEAMSTISKLARTRRVWVALYPPYVLAREITIPKRLSTRMARELVEKSVDSLFISVTAGGMASGMCRLGGGKTGRRFGVGVSPARFVEEVRGAAVRAGLCVEQVVPAHEAVLRWVLASDTVGDRESATLVFGGVEQTFLLGVAASRLVGVRHCGSPDSYSAAGEVWRRVTELGCGSIVHLFGAAANLEAQLVEYGATAVSHAEDPVT